MNKKSFLLGGSLSGVFVLLGTLLVACGADISTTGPGTTAASTGTVSTTTSATTSVATTANPTTVAPTSAAVTTTSAATSAVPVTTAAPTTTTPEPEATVIATPTIAPVTTVAPTTAPAATAALIFYLKEGSLWASKADGSNKQKLADNVYEAAVKTSGNQVVFYQKVKTGTASILQVKMIRLDSAGKVEAVLDNRANEALPTRDNNLEFQGRPELSISPDGSQVVYTKVNNAAPAFEGLRGNEHPIELWIANLDPNNPTAKRLAPNDKDFMARPTWSSDGNRIAFVRTTSFGTGAGYSTALWSVFKDGSRLSYLTGPEVAKVGNRTIQAIPAFNLNWVGPLALAYIASTQLTASIMLHDLSQNSDTSQPLAADADYNSAFCPQIRRYVYTRIDTNEYKQLPGAYSVGVDKPSTPDAALFDDKATAILGCQNDTVAYRDAAGQIYVQRLNTDGSTNGAKVKLGFATGDKSYPRVSIAPNGRYIAIGIEDSAKKTNTLSLYRADGVNVLVAGGNLNFSLYNLNWVGEQLLTMEGNINSQSNVLATVNLADANPAVKTLESATGIVQLAGLDR